MIAGVLLYNHSTNETLFRSPITLDDITTQDLINTFIKTPKQLYGSFLNNLNYVYTFKNGYFICIITTYQPYIVNDLMKLYDSTFTDDFFLNASIIDDTVNEETFFVFPPEKIQEYQKMESQEEKLHEMVKKSKEKELQKKLVEMKKKMQPTPIDLQLERVRELEMEIRKPLIEETPQKKEIKEIFRENKRKVEIDSEVQILLKEKLKIEVNKENDIKVSELEGDLSLNIRNEEFKFVEVQIDSSTELKFAPNLEKESIKKNILKNTKGFPLNKNIALVKWKRNKIDSLPLSFTFWPSDLEDGRFQILFEISAEEDLKDLMFCFNKEKMKDVFIETGNAEVKDYLEWNVGDINKGDNSTLEFTCVCTSPSDIFPINLFFTGSFLSSCLNIKGVYTEGKEIEYGLQNLCEVDSFVIVDE
ncbi:hypothetical protein H312_00828 [Anncaliia algerae PRA339]|uniref:Coatomer subunit delta n=1 Tax=Anncaliia algerae PRA339 TaxID=1288291 RepID=A0A059F3C4_9MICR|nr:hypothetical protein H312_00828 [Anncaliia algerae PRA339]